MSKQFYVLIKSGMLLLFLLSGVILHGQESIELDNDTLHLKLDLTRGGAINYISKSGTTRNIVNIHDEGRYIQQSYYAGQVLNRQADGQNPSWSPWSWNPIQVGDSYNNRAQILEYSENGNTLYVKCIPMLWDMNNMPAEAEMEQWTTLKGNVLKVRNKLTCYRTDDIYIEGVLNDQELPAVYPISALYNLYSYFGKVPFTGAPLDNPKVIHLEDGFWGRYENDMVTENWMAFVNDNLWGMGVYTPISLNFLAGMAGSPGYEATDGPTSYIAPVKKEILNKNTVFEYEYYLVIGTLNEIRSEIYSIKGIQVNAWEFTDGLEGWHVDPNGGTVVQSEGNLKFSVTGDDPHVYNHISSWQRGDLQYLWLRIKNETAGETGAYHFFSEAGDSASLSFTLTPNDTEYRDVVLNLDSIDFWTGDVTLNRFRLDPVSSNDMGNVYVDFIRFLEDLIEIRSEGDVAEIKGIGNNLQLYAEELPSYGSVEVDWSVDDPGIATVNENGLLTAVSNGVVTVTATEKDGSGKSATKQIVITDTDQINAWEFTSDLQGWDKNQHGGTVTHSEGTLKFTVSDGDPYVYKGVSPWTVGDLKYLWMRIKNETAGQGGAMYLFPSGGGHDFAPFTLTPNDSEFRDIYVDMRMAAIWNKNLVLDNFRLDPNSGGEPGDVYVDFIRFMEELVAVRSEGDATEIEGIGNTLQLYAEVMVSDDEVEVDWQVDKPEMAVVDSSGLLTSVAEGLVVVTATAQDGSSVSGTIEIAVIVDHSSIDYVESMHYRVYPNPAGEVLNIDNATDICKVTIVSLTGQVIQEVSNTHSHISINTESLDPGFYFLHATSVKGTTMTLRFVKS